MARSFDDTGFKDTLKHHGLHVVEVASTPAEKNSVLVDPQTDTHTNKALDEAIKLYSKHYLMSQDGIPGEGEDIDVILSRLRGEDPHVKRVSVLGLTDDQGHIQGVAFIETYEIDKQTRGKDGRPEHLEGLAHLLTYAAVEPNHDNPITNAAFHAGIMDAVTRIDKELGHAGNSVLVTEVNSVKDFDGNWTSGKMDAEFEIKTGSRAHNREAYEIAGRPEIITLEGAYNKSHILHLGHHYVAPNLGGEGDHMPRDIRTADDLAPHLKNVHIENGIGEPLFLTAESAYNEKLTRHEVELHRAFQEKLGVSVAHGNFGITDADMVIEARGKVAGFKAMDEGYQELAEKAEQHGKPPSKVDPAHTHGEEVEKHRKRAQGE